MPEWDVAAGNPCPLCACLEECPNVGEPGDACLERWPLGKPQHRSLGNADPRQKSWTTIALQNADVKRIVKRWSDDKQVADEDYLTLRSLINGAATDHAAEAYWHIMGEFLMPKAEQYFLDAVSYYDLNPLDTTVKVAFANALRGGVIVANEFMVEGDTSVPVPSHFERVVFEVVKVALFAVAGMPFLDLPRQRRAFKNAVEEEWRRVLAYGNGYHGFTVHPRVHIEDMVRYQKLDGSDDLVSWSISNWIVWSMTAFPSLVQTVAPDFGEKALGDRLVDMYEPLVQSYAGKLMHRAKVTEGGDAVPRRSDAVGALRALLRDAIDSYDFNYNKPEEMLSSVGIVGPASSPEWREDFDDRFKRLGLPFTARDLVHVGFPRYVVGKFDEHLRECYPWHDKPFGDTEGSSGAMVQGDGEVPETFREETATTRRRSDVGPGVEVAATMEGINYLYIQQMAFVCGPEITVDQLRNWDRRGHLETLRMRDIDPGAPDTIAHRRIYPYTNEMVEQIRELAERKEMLQANPKEGMLSRKNAADRLDITTRTLDKWRQEGKIEAVEIEHRVLIPEDEVERLLAERETES